MTKHLFLFLCICLANVGVANAQSWVQVKGHPIAYDGNSLVRQGEVVSYWLRTTSKGEVTSLWAREMDCKNRVDRTVEHFWLYKDGSRNSTGPKYNVERIAPGSDLEVLHSQICARSWEFWKRWF